MTRRSSLVRRRDIEVKSETDWAWYDGSVDLEEDDDGSFRVRVQFEGFTHDYDEFWGTEILNNEQEIRRRVRLRSPRLSSSDCSQLVENMVICGNYVLYGDVKFYDATVISIARIPHTRDKRKGRKRKGRKGECLCTFTVRWDEGPMEGHVTTLQNTKGNGQVYLITSNDVSEDPIVNSILNCARQNGRARQGDDMVVAEDEGHDMAVSEDLDDMAMEEGGMQELQEVQGFAMQEDQEEQVEAFAMQEDQEEIELEGFAIQEEQAEELQTFFMQEKPNPGKNLDKFEEGSPFRDEEVLGATVSEHEEGLEYDSWGQGEADSWGQPLPPEEDENPNPLPPKEDQNRNLLPPEIEEDDPNPNVDVEVELEVEAILERSGRHYRPFDDPYHDIHLGVVDGVVEYVTNLENGLDGIAREILSLEKIIGSG